MFADVRFFCAIGFKTCLRLMPRSGQLQPQPQLSPEPHTLFTSDCSVPFLHMQYARAARSGQPQPLNALEENTFPHVPRMSRIMRIQRQRLPPKQQFIVFPPISISAMRLRVTAAGMYWSIFLRSMLHIMSFCMYLCFCSGHDAWFCKSFCPTCGPFGCQIRVSLL